MNKKGCNAKEFLPTIAVSLGDPAGVGPEVAARALSLPEVFDKANWLVCGPEKPFKAALERIGSSLSYTVFSKLLPEGVVLGRLAVLDPQLPVPVAEVGKPDEHSGRWAASAIESAVEFALRGYAQAVVTCPISKSRLIAAGKEFPGHTEMIASLCGVKKPIMLLASGDLKVALLTRHLALRNVFPHIKKKTILDFLVALDYHYRRWFDKSPRIAMLGLNPHCGEDGLFGTEEQTAIRPAIEAAQARKVNVEGPVPADTAFCEGIREEYDVIAATYHDQGLGPFKALAFDSGVNMTLGLPFIRTSPDHGTAFDIAPRYCADSSSMVEAMKYAIQLSPKAAR
ncbi:MAG: 4-hydroxythreonine-4-phosphate dehydrogenase PdxA [Planctomycetota bacterium]